MSRCFPFPPPGYEKKPRSGEHGDLLAKEKHKEKKHKKEEKGKERKDNDKSKDKHKEKKERKEKHRDKKKDKDRDRERNKTSEDQRTEIHHEDKLGYDSRKADEFRDSKFTEELGRRIRHEEQGATNCMVEGISATPNRRIESTGTSTAMVNKMSTNVPVTIQRNEKLTPSFHKRTEVMEISTATEKQKTTSSEKVHDITSTERRRNEYLIPQVQKRTETMGNATAMEKQRAANNHKVGDFTNLVERTEGTFTLNSIQRERVTGNNLVSNTTGSSTKKNDQATENLTSIPRRIESIGAAPATEKGRFMLPNVISTEQRKAERMELPVEKATDKKTEGKEKSKEKKAEEDKREGHKDSERKEKKRKEKDKNRDKEKKKEEKKREKREHKRSKHDKSKENEIKNQKPNLNHMTLAPHVENINAAGADGPNKTKEFEGNPDGSDGPNKKRKELEMNGFLHEPQHDGRLSKLPRTSVFHPPVENGRPTDGRPTEFASGCSSLKLGGRPSKLPRTSVASFHPPVENGRPTEFASGCSPIKLGGINNMKVGRGLDNNGKHINGRVEVQPSPLRKPHIPPVVDSSSKVAVQPSARLKSPIPPVVDSTVKVAVQPSAVTKSPVPRVVDSSSKAAVQPSPVLKPPIPPVVDSSGKAAIEPSPVLKPPIPSVVDSSVKVAVQSSPVRKPPVVQPSRPPHPDTNYLSTIYTVPKMEELSESGDLDWLFNDKKPPSTTKVEADGMPPQVGAKGLQIESADVFALPYVIPF